MSSEIIPSSFPKSGSDEFPAGPPGPDSDFKPPETPAGVPGYPPDPMGPGTASGDDLPLSPDRLCPDPLLEEFLPGSADAVVLPAPDPASPVGHPRSPAGTTPTAPSPPGSWSQFGLNRGTVAGSPVAQVPAGGTSSPSESPRSEISGNPATRPDPAASIAGGRSASGVFPAIDLSAPPHHGKPEPAGAHAKAQKVDDSDEDDEEEDDLARRPSNWPMVLLASYASALTIGLIWDFWSHHRSREDVELDTFPPANASGPGHRTDSSGKPIPPAPLPAERVAPLGKMLRIGSLEVTPLEVFSGPVTLRHEIQKGEMRRGGEGALSLRLRLKNIGSESVLSPMDETFLRERGAGVLDSFLESGPGRQVPMFPLAVVSEWSVVGQEFRDLRPGESYETLVVSAPDASAGLGPDEWTWRVRLRTDVNQTETVGVRFRAGDVVAKPGPPLPKAKEKATGVDLEDPL
jgi:hypothetical protein